MTELLVEYPYLLAPLIFLPELLMFRLEHFELLLYFAATNFWPHLLVFCKLLSG